MNNLIPRFYSHGYWDKSATLITPLLDTGAEFAKFVASRDSGKFAFGSACRLIEIANSAGFIDGK